jgi:hypothetical protein
MCNLRHHAPQDLKSRTQVISWIMFQMVGDAWCATMAAEFVRCAVAPSDRLLLQHV